MLRISNGADTIKSLEIRDSTISSFLLFILIDKRDKSDFVE